MNLIRTEALINEAKMRCQCLRLSQVNELSFLPIYSRNQIFWGSLLSQNIWNSPPPGPSSTFETAVCRQIIYRDLVKCRFWLWVQDSAFLTGYPVMLMLPVPDTHLEWQGLDWMPWISPSPLHFKCHRECEGFTVSEELSSLFDHKLLEDKACLLLLFKVCTTAAP